jgi:hypothetical protein
MDTTGERVDESVTPSENTPIENSAPASHVPGNLLDISSGACRPDKRLAETAAARSKVTTSLRNRASDPSGEAGRRLGAVTGRPPPFDRPHCSRIS